MYELIEFLSKTQGEVHDSCRYQSVGLALSKISTNTNPKFIFDFKRTLESFY